MSRVSVSAIVASTHSITKYPGWEMPPGVLEQMALELKKGEVPLLFGHDVTQPLDGRVTDARVIETEDGHQAVQVDLDVDAAEWRTVEDRFSDAGVPGGMSFRATAIETPPSSGERAVVTIAMDAGAWSDADRASAVATLDAVAPTEGAALFEFSVVEVVAILFVLQNVAMSVLGNATYDAIRGLFGTQKRGTSTRVEIKTTNARGDVSTAVVETDDAEVAIAALKQLEAAEPAPLVVYDQESERWVSQ